MHINQHGHIHFVLLGIAVVMLIVLTGFSINNTPQQANLHHATAAKVKQQKRIANRDLSYFRVAAEQYFESGDTYGKAQCKPKDVRIKYYRGSQMLKGSLEADSLAYAYIGGAFKKIPLATKDKHSRTIYDKTPSKYYCRIYWNIEKAFALTIDQQCHAFMHEYGHLLGRQHNDDITSVMYNGFFVDLLLGKSRSAKDSPLFKDNVENVGAKSICPRPVGDNKI
jgi:hypothetical protein